MDNPFDFYCEQAEYCGKCSEQIANLCRSAGIEYYHFLQPNQYVENSKEITSREHDIAYVEGSSPYKDAVITGYPLLIKVGETLK